ncbi:hypothetical protein JK359_36185 [Streptomyces actinomycinicus]|uniref:Uncharacterized protein n=1 Tax=Streptomyces actinomycinicus TaxID=1695166 RepID=A0A937JU00_9ACTN|nr:hypothetical protein [Streptomyces actinomycinicus]MBL1087328.1 hypothetical protein [Streptomyces actinomycinicus]
MKKASAPALSVVAVLVLAASALVWWLLRVPAPYALSRTPEVEVTVRPVKSRYPEAGEVAGQVDLLLKVYVQRLEAGDTAELSELGAPWYTGRDAAARKLITRYGAHAGDAVQAVVQDPAVPNLASVELRFGDGQRQTLGLSRDHDDVWWLQLGDGDPVAP